MSLSNQIVRPGLITPGNASYASVVLADKPVAFYLLNETAGTVAHDASGHGNTGTLQGGIVLNQRAEGGWALDGALQACAIYATALTPAQIRTHYNAGRTALRMTGGMIA